MGQVADALGPLTATPDVQTPKRSSVQTFSRPGAQTSARPSVETPKRSDAQAPKRLGVQASTPLPPRGTAKSQHPEFGKRTIYVRDTTHKAALRKWEDADGGDFSDLVEDLLLKYTGGN